MKGSELLKSLYKKSRFESYAKLAEYLGLDEDFIKRTFNGKHGMAKVDKLFEELAGMTIEEFFFMKELMEHIRKELIEKDQIL